MCYNWNMEYDGRKRPFGFGMIFLAMCVGFLAGSHQFEIKQTILTALGQKVDKVPLDLKSVQQSYDQIVKNFDGQIDRQKLIDGASKGLVEAAGDEHTTYMTNAEFEEFEKHLAGDVGVGVGIEVGLRNKIPTVIRPLKDNPAIVAGVRAGDVIFKVNGEDVSKKSVQEITQKIKGEAGTTVKLTLLRNGEEKDFSIVRQKINNPSVELDFDGNVAVLTISRFDDETGNLARKFAQEIKEKGATKIILDLRDNGGGYVSAAQAVASLWVSKGEVVVKQRSGGKITDVTRATGGNILAGIETIVLGNEGSASASEIVIGALKSHKMARFLGGKTYGKGSVQSTFSTNYGVLKITIAKWLTPDDKNIDKQGIEPDQKIELTEDDKNAGRDPQMDAAKK